MTHTKYLFIFIKQRMPAY